MQNKNIIRIVLDITMIVIFILLYNTMATGLLFHEAAGLIIVGIIAIHILVNKKWIEAIGSFVKNREKHKKQLYRLALNISLMAGTIIVLTTGIMISTYIFPALNAATDELITLHKWTSYILGGALVLHTVLHWKFIVYMARKLLAEGRAAALKTAMVGVGAVALALFVVYNNVLSIIGSGGNYVMEISSVPAANSAAVTQETASLPVLPSEAYYGAGAGAGTTLPSEGQTVEQTGSSSESGENILPDTQSGDVDEAISVPSEPAAEQITLQDFLRSMFCTACPKQCSLAAPQCGKSRAQIQQATAEYEATYGVSE